MSDTKNITGRMRAAFVTTPVGDDRWQAVLDVLHQAGYRRCAEGQAVTQWCAEAERVRANLKALEDEHIAYADDVGDALGQGEDEPLLTCARRVVAEVERLRADAERLAIREVSPLTDDEIYELADTSLYDGGKNYGVLSFGRAVERAHGIGTDE